MISLIVCSRKTTLNQDFLENIKNTIGCAFELIVIDNSENKYSIAEAYNLGIERSNGELLCFIHQDIFIHSNGWGKSLYKIFRDIKGIGLLGVAGSKIKTRMPSAWWESPVNYHVINLIQHFEGKDKQVRNYGFGSASEIEVAVIDGVFMAMAKDRIVRFNPEIKGFHSYDLTASIANQMKGLKVFVTNKIQIEHFSSGNINNDWFLSTLKFHNVYKKNLPISIGSIQTGSELLSLEFTNGAIFADKLIERKMIKEAVKLWFELLLIKPLSRYHLRFISKMLKSI